LNRGRREFRAIVRRCEECGEVFDLGLEFDDGQ